MAFPIIKIDSTDGGASDTAASGAGPATAVTGTAHNSATPGTTLTLVSGDTTNIATDGSHAVYCQSSGRRFGRIVGKTANSLTTTGSWPSIDAGSPVNYAVGGVRASLGHADTRLLMEQAASAAGDASAGWVVELQDGHTETLSATLHLRVAANTTDGPFRLRGNPSSVTRPVLTFSNNGPAIQLNVETCWVENVELKNTSVTKTSTSGVANRFDAIGNGLRRTMIKDVAIRDVTDYFLHGIESTLSGSNDFGCTLVGCEIANCQSDGVTIQFTSSAFAPCDVINCYIHDNGGSGVLCGNGNGYMASTIYRSIFSGNSSHGIHFTASADSNSFGSGVSVTHCTFDGNGGSGVSIGQQRTMAMFKWIGNNFTGNTAYGIAFPAAVTTDAAVFDMNFLLIANNFHGNTSGATNITAVNSDGFTSHGNFAVDPTYVSQGTGNYTVGHASLVEGGYPAGNIPGSITPAYPYVGTGEPQAAGGYTPTYRRRAGAQLRM